MTTTSRPSSRDRLTASLTPDQEIHFQAWRADALARMPYFARPLFALRVINAPGLGTFAVDAGYRLYIDFDAVIPLGPGYCSEALLHECSHLFAGHSGLAADMGIETTQQRKDFNAAGDAAINDDLQDAGCTFVPNPQIHIVPESLGAERNKTPKHYYDLIQKLRANQNRKQIAGDVAEVPALTCMPASLRHGDTQGQLVTLHASAPFIDPLNFTVTVTDEDANGNPVRVPVSVQGANPTTIGVIIGADLDLGGYLVELRTSGGITAEAYFGVVKPTINVEPRTIESGWPIPMPMRIVGDNLTRFNDTTTVTVEGTDDQGRRFSVPISTTTRLSNKEIRFDLTQRVPDGLYFVTVTEHGALGPEDFISYFTIGLPTLHVDPDTLPVGYPDLTPMSVSATDFGFTAATVLAVEDMLGAPVQIANYQLASITEVTFDLPAGLPEGAYLVKATNSTTLGTVEAIGSFAVTQGGSGDSNSDGSDDSDESEGSEGESGEGAGEGSGEKFTGCGSGSGGTAAPCEIDLDDDLDGTAPAAPAMEREIIDMDTAASIRDYAAKHPGTVPGGLVEMAHTLLMPSKTPWREKMRAYLGRAVSAKRGRSRSTYMRRNRRMHGYVMHNAAGEAVGSPIYPAKLARRITLHVLRDTSGSMSSRDLAVVGREIYSMSVALGIKGDDLLVTDCDTVVHPPVRFDHPDSISEVKGRGGTDMCVGIEAIINLPGAKPALIPVLTDGYTDWPAERLTVPVMAVLAPRQGEDSVPSSVIDRVPDWIPCVVLDRADLDAALDAEAKRGS